MLLIFYHLSRPGYAGQTSGTCLHLHSKSRPSNFDDSSHEATLSELSSEPSADPSSQPSSEPSAEPSSQPSSEPSSILDGALVNISLIEVPSPSPPPQDLSRRHLAEQMNQFFEVANDRKDLQAMLEDSFEHVEDMEEIFLAETQKPLAGDVASLSFQSYAEAEDDLPGSDSFDCGGVWKGKAYDDDSLDLAKRSVFVVVSHCKNALDWIAEYTAGFDVASIHVISICEQDPTGLAATIEMQPSIASSHHAFAYYISSVLPQKLERHAGINSEETVVVFLKDDANVKQSGNGLNDFASLVKAASSEQGFGCGFTLDSTIFGQHRFLLSAYHGAYFLSTGRSTHRIVQLTFAQHSFIPKKPRRFVRLLPLIPEKTTTIWGRGGILSLALKNPSKQ